MNQKPGFSLSDAHRQAPSGRSDMGVLPLGYRNDGFTMYFHTEPPMTRTMLEAQFIDPFEGSNVKILIWGVGPGSTLCYDTKVGEIFGEGVTEAEWQEMRPKDRWVYENVRGLIEAGADPLRVAAERGHEIGLKVFGRLELNQEFALGTWYAIGFAGNFYRNHQVCLVPGTPHLDFKYREVRDFKLTILREAAEAGMDGVELDFMRRLPHFAEPDCEIMTQFMRDCQQMLDEVGTLQNRRMEVMARVPWTGCLEEGLDWKTWMWEGLVDIVAVTFRDYGNRFAITVDAFVEMGRKTGCKVYGCIWFDLGLVSHDPTPEGRRRYAKPKTREMFYAEALLYHRAGVDGIQLAWGTGDEWLSEPWQNDLADLQKIAFADKHYMVDVGPHIPVWFPLPEEAPFESRTEVPLHIGDDIAAAHAEGYRVNAELIFYSRGLREGEALSITINGRGPVRVTGGTPEEEDKPEPILWERKPTGALIREGPWIFEPDWWKRGEHRVGLDARWLHLGENTIELVHETADPEGVPAYWISWIDLILKYTIEKETSYGQDT